MISIFKKTSLHLSGCGGETSVKVPRIPFKRIADEVLERGYELSLVFVDSKTIRELNKQYRHKDKATNILSFPLSNNEGEILIDPITSQEEAGRLDEKFGTYLAYLFIHGLTHLKGFDHGSRMEVEEKKVRDKFPKFFHASKL